MGWLWFACYLPRLGGCPGSGGSDPKLPPISPTPRGCPTATPQLPRATPAPCPLPDPRKASTCSTIASPQNKTSRH
eukprot:scaffold16780_cov192-Skeletonema_marinoi.AAC.4